MGRESGSVISAVSGASVEIDQSAVRSVDAERVELRQAAAQHVRGESLDVVDSAMLSVRASDVRMEECASFVVVGEQVEVRDSTTIFLLARKVEGNVRATLTPSSAFALGLGAVVGMGILRRLRRR